MSDGTGLAEVLLGLPGFRALDVLETTDEVVVTIESLLDLVGCARCGVRAESHDRMRVEIRDLACFGRPARLVWVKRRWRCVEPACDAKTWTALLALAQDRRYSLARSAWGSGVLYGWTIARASPESGSGDRGSSEGEKALSYAAARTSRNPPR